MVENFINCTGKQFNIVNDDNTLYALLPSEHIAKCIKTEKEVKTYNGFTIKKQVLEVEGLPEPKDGIWYIVDEEVAIACPNRSDLLIIGPEVMDEAGIFVGYRGFTTL